jgi:hypothetical protein
VVARSRVLRATAVSGNGTMAVDIARRRTRRTTKITQPPPIAPHVAETIAIGEVDQSIFSCPVCQRPLATGARHCPGCRTRLVAGIQLQKASLFVVAGLAIGVALGGGLGAMALFTNTLARDAEINARVAAALAANGIATGPDATTGPGASSRPLGSSGPGAVSRVPPLARSAMIQSATVNAELAAAVPVLQSALAAKKFDTYTVFQVLRSISADAVVGRQLAAHVSAWSGGEELGGSLSTFYSIVQDTAAEGLDASIRNDPAYKAAAKQMIKLLVGVAALDEQLRTAASDAGVEIPAPAP